MPSFIVCLFLLLPVLSFVWTDGLHELAVALYSGLKGNPKRVLFIENHRNGKNRFQTQTGADASDVPPTVSKCPEDPQLWWETSSSGPKPNRRSLQIQLGHKQNLVLASAESKPPHVTIKFIVWETKQFLYRNLKQELLFWQFSVHHFLLFSDVKVFLSVEIKELWLHPFLFSSGLC